MPSLPEVPAQKPISRFQAQRSLGLFATHDYVMGLVFVACLLVMAAYVVFTPVPDLKKCLLGVGVMLTFQLAWLIVLVYRVLVFVLDVHADIVLLPEASARIAVGYLQGKPVTKR